MATVREISALYDNVTLQKEVPSTYAEAEAVIGEAGGLLSGWLADTIARNFLPRVYNVISKEIESKFPAAVVKTEGEGEKKKDIYESSIKHVGRYWESLDDDGKKELTARFQSVATELPIWAAGDRSGTGKVPEWATEAANQVLASGNDAAEDVLSQIEADMPAGTKFPRESDGTVTPDVLARAMAALARYEQEKAKQSVTARFKPSAA